MHKFLKETVEGEKYELLIDVKIFPKEIILKAAYNFLDKGYFFFKYEGNDILLQFSRKTGNEEKIEDILKLFTDELLSVLLRDNLEKQNKSIREAIVGAAIANSIDEINFQSINTDIVDNQETNEIDFDKDIDDILKEIENDPELKIDENEISKILEEIENESELEVNMNHKAGEDNSKDMELDNDIDKILKDLENDPELKIDEEEINKILEEIEKESELELNDKPVIKLNLDGFKDAKNKFSN